MLPHVRIHALRLRKPDLKFLNLKVMQSVFSIPLLVILMAHFTGHDFKEALTNCLNMLIRFPDNAIVFFFLIGFSLVTHFYLVPVFVIWNDYLNKRQSSQCTRDAAMVRFNNLDKLSLVLSITGFILGQLTETLFTVYGQNQIVFSLVFQAVLQGFANGLLVAILLSMSLNHLLYPVKKILVLQGSNIRQKYSSQYKHFSLAMVALVFFLLTQIFSITTDFLDLGLKTGAGPAFIPGSIKSTSLFRFQDQDIKSGVFVLFVRTFFYILISFRLIMLIKYTIKNPIETVESKLSSLNSEKSFGGKLIDIVNNDEFTRIFGEINKLISRQQGELELNQERLHKIIDNAPDPILSFDSRGKIYIFNPAAENYFRYKREDISGESLRFLFSKETVMECGCDNSDDEFIKFLVAEENRKRRFTGLCAGGEELNFEANISVTQTPEGPLYTAILRDINSQIEVEQTLTQARIAAENANRLKSEFLANMSHELRTPLNAVLGFTQLLSQDKNLTDGQLDRIGIISRSGEHLLALINDILDISKIEAGKIELHPVAFNLPQFVDDLKQMFELKCRKKGLAFYVEILDGLPEYVEGDLGKLRQILINLLGNATKFTDEGGISVIVGKDENKIRFSVTDTGKGIPADEIQKVLQPFMQSSNTDNEGGTGLGLPISNSYIEMMGGELSITSELNKGTTFSFAIELAEAAAGTVEVEDHRLVLGIEDGRHPKILIVDDKLHNRLILKEMLERVGFVTQEAEDGKQALSIASDFQPEVVFMDIKMPVMDGYESVMKFKSDTGLKQIPVFALTASAFKHDEKRIFDSGFNGFLAKPFKLNSLFNLIMSHTDIRFIYDHESPVQAKVSEKNLDLQSIAPKIKENDLKILKDLLSINDFIGVKKWAADISLKPDLSELSVIIQGLAKDFDEDGLNRLLEDIIRIRGNK